MSDAAAIDGTAGAIATAALSGSALPPTGLPDAIADPLADYQLADPVSDIYASAGPQVAASWHQYALRLAGQAHGDLTRVQPLLDRHVQDLGLAFRLVGDENERAWPLNPVPIFLGAEEWSRIEAGLIQRADLLETIIADLYGAQRLVGDGRIPAAVASGSNHFARRMVGTRPPGGHFLSVAAVDLIRSPDGTWQVLSDRVRLPVGIGYALENRLAITRVTGGMLAAMGVRRQDSFFDAFRLGIAACCGRSDPRIGLLTPGRYNQSYPEQAHLARYLGFSLVEGRDLVVREDKLFVRTIDGPKRIDALWRWIGARDIDPLAFDAGSRIGVPNLIAAAQHGLALANWPGCGFVESKALAAYLPALARSELGAELILPSVETWWCGEAGQRAHALAHLSELVISSAFRQPVQGLDDGRTRLGSSLSPQERAAIVEGIARRPMDYAAQQIVSLSTTPALFGGRFEARPFTLRAFLARDDAGAWTVLPGGFARISDRGELRTALMGRGDISADVCIVDRADTARRQPSADVAAPAIRRSQGLLPSQAADNLFWIGRYCERAHQTARAIRTLIEQVVLAGERAEAASAVTGLANFLRRLGAAPPQSVSWLPSQLAATALGDSARPGSVHALTIRSSQIALLLRDRFGRDTWRTIRRGFPGYVPGDLDSMTDACDQLIDRFATLGRLLEDGISRGPAWDFLALGTALERASMILQAVQALAPGAATRETLSALLDFVEAQPQYRSRYFALPFLAPVLDLLLLDPAQPLGLAFQLATIERHLAALPSARRDGMPEQPLRLARQLRARIDGTVAETIDAATIAALMSDLGGLSNAIGARYFLQDELPVAEPPIGILA